MTAERLGTKFRLPRWGYSHCIKSLDPLSRHPRSFSAIEPFLCCEAPCKTALRCRARRRTVAAPQRDGAVLPAPDSSCTLECSMFRVCMSCGSFLSNASIACDRVPVVNPAATHCEDRFEAQQIKFTQARHSACGPRL